jgi:hypothetical protein
MKKRKKSNIMKKGIKKGGMKKRNKKTGRPLSRSLGWEK